MTLATFPAGILCRRPRVTRNISRLGVVHWSLWACLLLLGGAAAAILTRGPLSPTGTSENFVQNDAPSPTESAAKVAEPEPNPAKNTAEKLPVADMPGGSPSTQLRPPVSKTSPPPDLEEPAKAPPLVLPPLQPGQIPLNKEGTIVLDKPRNRLLVHAEVVLTDGLLEMLLCLKQTKEHESILAVNAKAFVIHTGLLALGAKSGTPVRFQPKFTPPSGDKIDIYLNWVDASKKPQRVPAQQWIRNATRRYFAEKLPALPPGVSIPRGSDLKYDAKNQELVWYGKMSDAQRDEIRKLSEDTMFRKAVDAIYTRTQPKVLSSYWVFTGSGMYVDERDPSKKHYQAEGGDVICVANFPTAMMDLAISSSASGEENLLFEAYTERIPPRGTLVTLELIPDLKPPPKK